MVEKRTYLFLAVACAVICWAATGSAFSQTYPNKPIRLIVGFPAGGGTDVTARMLGEALTKAWGQPVIIENKAGAGGAIATEAVAKAAPDGFTLLMGGGSAMTVNPAVYQKLPYDPLKDFAAITMVLQSPLVIAVHPSLPIRSVQDLLAYVKTNPGKANFSSSNTLTQLAAAMLSQMSGATINPIPYKGGGPSVNGVLTGDVPITIVDTGSVLGQIRGGLLRGIAVTTATRAIALPELPTVAESGIPGYDLALWYGLFAPAGTPKDIISKINGEVARIVSSQEIREIFANTLGGEAVGNTSDQFTDQIRNDIARFTKIARAANMKVADE